jgi:hypothetical protein
MGTPAAPRLDPRLLQYVCGARLGTPAAEVTRAVGDLAWELGMPRPSYEQVRSLLRRRVRLVTSRSVPNRFPRAGLRALLALRRVARRVRAIARRLLERLGAAIRLLVTVCYELGIRAPPR